MRRALACLCAVLLYGYLWPYESDPNLRPSAIHWLGTDEFGRDVVVSAIRATVNTATTASGLSIAVIALSALIVFAAAAVAGAKGGRAASFVLSVLESCPLIVWIFVIVSALIEFPRFYAITLGFVIAVVPVFVAILYGEYARLSSADFVQAARCSGVSERRIFFLYILPNASAVLFPLSITVFGMAIALDGAIGLVGMGNRSELDLGIMLIRAREQLLTNPAVALGVSGALLLLYWVLHLLRRVAERRTISIVSL